MSSQTAVTAPLGTLGEQIARKQSGVDLRALVTASPSAREQRKGGKAPVAAPKGFRFAAPTLIRPVLSVQDESIRQQALEDLENFKRQIGPYMQDLIKAVRQIERLSEDEQQLAAGDWDALQSAIAETLNASDALAKQLATIAYADAMIQTCPSGRGWVITTLKDLVEKGFLVDSPKPETNVPFRPKTGQILAYSRLYSLAPAFSRNDEAQLVLASISNLVSRAVAAGREYFETQRDKAVASAGAPEAQLTLDQLSSPTCPDGLRHLPVPQQKWTGKGDNREHFRREGGIVIRVAHGERGPAIVMVAGYGGVEQDAERICEANAFITLTSLRHDRLQLNQKVEPAQYWAITQLHRLVRLGIVEAAGQEKRNSAKAEFNTACHAEREALAAKAVLSADEFLVDEKVGTAVVHWAPGAFEWRNRYDRENRQKLPDLRVWHLFGLFERDEQGRIRVAECPDRLVEFFAGHRDFEVAGQEYSELGKLGVVLRRAKANLTKAAERAAAGEPNGADAPSE